MFRSRPRRPPQSPTSGDADGPAAAAGPGDAALPAEPGPPAAPAAERWQVIGSSVRGALHVRKGLGNQDAIRWEPADGCGPRVALAVADGHGSAKSFRSATGSRFAVEVSVALAAKLIEQDPLDLSFVKDQLEHGVPEQIVRDWLARVDADLSESPFSEEELLGVQERAGRPGLESVEASPRLAYGSTLLTVIATEAFVAFWQIGDGDLLTVSANGHVGEPVPGDEQLVADETTSLCSRDAWRSFRVGVLGTPVPMMMLSTDGFANSFQDNAGFRKFGTDVRDIILTEGLGMVRDKLDPWLNDITERGSGDDISLGIVCRPRALAGLPDEPPPPEPPEPGPEPEPGSTQVTVVLQRRNIVILAFVQVGRGFRYVFVRLPAQLFRSRSQET